MDGIVTEEQQETQDTQQLKNKQTTTLRAFTNKRKEIDELATSGENLHLVKTAMDELKQLKEQCESAHIEYMNALPDEERQPEQKKYEPNRLKIIGGMQTILTIYLQPVDQLVDPEGQTHQPVPPVQV
jgi:hypothetical protein